VASRKEPKVAKLEIDSFYLYEKIPRNIGAITKVSYLIMKGECWYCIGQSFRFEWLITVTAANRQTHISLKGNTTCFSQASPLIDYTLMIAEEEELNRRREREDLREKDLDRSSVA